MHTRTITLRIPFALALATGLVLAGSVRLEAGQTASLAELIAGIGPNGNGTLIEGDKIFSAFGAFTRIGTGGADAPQASEIQATTYVDSSNNIGLIFSSAKWNVDPNQTIDTGWGFTVTALGASIIDAELGLLSYATDGGSNIHITESLSNGVNLLVEAPNGPTFDHHVFSPVQSLRIFKDVSLEGHANGHASLSTLSQTFSQTPEPGTIMTAAMGIAFASLAVTRRRRQKQA